MSTFIDFDNLSGEQRAAFLELMDAAKLALRYLEHPDVRAIPFALLNSSRPPDNIVDGPARLRVALLHLARAIDAPAPQLLQNDTPDSLRAARERQALDNSKQRTS